MGTRETTTTPGATVTRFGHAMRTNWALDPHITYLNHGTVGATPRRVLEAQRAIRDEIESQPARFLLRELTPIATGKSRVPKPRLRMAADQVAAFLGASGDDLVFVDNATTGVNAVLRSFGFAKSDEILITDLTYGGVANAARYVTRTTGAEVRVVEMPLVDVTPDKVRDVIAGAVGPRTRLAVIDHVSAESAMLFPVAEIAARCHAAGAAVLVDGAHAPGAIPLDIPALGADWYVGNLHKWGFAPRSSGILWAAPARQKDLHPPVISWGLDQGFAAEFDLVGTRDPSPHLAAPAAIAFMRELGVEAMRTYNHGLAWEAGRWLCERWGTVLPVGEEMIGAMVTVPLPERYGSVRDDAQRLRDALLYEHGIEVQVHAFRDRLWTRISAQVYNEMADVERLAHAVDVCA